MRAYGIPRTNDLEYPDKGDIKQYGLSTTDRCSRADRGKNRARRRFKKIERANANRAMVDQIYNDEE